MDQSTELAREIFRISNDLEFEKLAERIFHYQYKHCEVYREFCDYLGQKNPSCLEEIPFLPIQYFKTREIYCGKKKPELVFKSSGTTKQTRSKHFVSQPSLYHSSYTRAFESYFGPVDSFCILALLPSYLEQGNSSLIYMVEGLIKASKNSDSGFILNDKNTERKIEEAIQKNQKVLLFGVSYALLDLADQGLDLSSCSIIETGGMKGRREEWSKEKLQSYLLENLNQPTIYSEYGMTELLSQGYSKKDDGFEFPKWSKPLIRQTNDPLQYTTSATGAVNMIDLANLHSCSFIATDDLGKLQNGRLSLKGRMDHSDIRGCNLMIE